MTITFVSNLLHHHQIPICNEWYRILGENFHFISTLPFPESMLSIGYEDHAAKYPYNINSFKGEEELSRAKSLIDSSDVVIFGSAPDTWFHERIVANKLTFRYSERLFKKSSLLLLDPRIMRFSYLNHFRYRKNNLHLLCASAYMANDAALIASYPDKMYKWGYFTSVKQLDIDQLLRARRGKKVQILWVARFLKWKHPELAIKAAAQLRDSGLEFSLNMFGSGDQLERSKRLVEDLALGEHVYFKGNASNEEILNQMQRSDIFLFTSDRNEGWGSVLNESMASGCAVIAAHEIGSAPFLITHKENGVLFKSNCLDDLTNKLEQLITNSVLRERLARSAYCTMRERWSPEIAANNFIRLAGALLSNQMNPIQDAPCAPAYPINIREL